MTDNPATRTVLLPNVELNMENVIVTDVFVGRGDRVVEGQALAAVETQKASIEIPSTEAGYVHEVFIHTGDEIGEKAPVCSLGDEPPAAETPPSSPPVDSHKMNESSGPVPPDLPPKTSGRVRASPVARKVARALGIALDEVAGTGPLGRIMRRDVEALQQARQAPPESPSAFKSDARAPEPAAHGIGEGWLPFPPARAALIAQMQGSIRTVPIFSLSRKFDVTTIHRKEPGITLTHRLIACLGHALAAHRSLLTTIEGERYRIEDVAVAVAMDSKAGLVAPAVRRPQSLTIPEIAALVQFFKARADAGRLKRTDFERAPFALSNLGMHGIDQFQPSVFQGQCAVLGTGRAVDGPAGRKAAWFTLTCDHRAVDGAEAARFLQTLQETILSA